MKIFTTILAILFALMFINAGLDKFLHYMPQPEGMPEEAQKAFAAFMQIPWLMPLVGAIEVIGGLLVLFPKTRTLGAIVILPVMIGILAHNCTVAPAAPGIAIAVVLLFINLWILFDNKHKLKAIID
jgi:uncharacterized membrane protein YphA (DoxX/SURF4 family)